jgi:prepilin-type N-terminal cleavage/methylation domain-containing protein
MKRGFSLVELAVVLLIISLIIAAIASGTSLIRQAEMRSVIADLQSFRTAYRDFIVRYKQIPGDMINATTFWTPASCSLGPTCNGDGNNKIGVFNASALDETVRAWKHLSLALLIQQGIVQIPATYTGVLTVGNLTPASKVQGAGFWMAGGGAEIARNSTAGTQLQSPWSDTLQNAVFMGRASPFAGSDGLAYGSASGMYAYNIDKKIDDGAVDASSNSTGYNTGKFRAVTDASGSNCIAGSSYVINSSAESCIMGFQLHDR